MEAVAEVVLSVSLELLLKKLASSDLWKYARQEKIESELNTWKKNLQKINKVLDDAEEKQITDASVREWLAELRDLAYDVDDLLDKFKYDMMRRELKGADEDDAIGGSSSSKVRKFFLIPSCCNNFSPRQAKRNVDMGRKMEEITRRLESISGQKGDLGLENLKRVIQGTRSAASDQTPVPPPVAHEAWVFGRNEDRKKILAMLLNSPHNDEQEPNPNLSVVSIVAMGGMGKTTVADLVYIDAQISQHFCPKAWVCVSDKFDLETVTRQILFHIDPSKKDLQSLRQVQDELRDQLKGKRFLIVLDDVWAEDYEQWDTLRSPLLNGAPGSKILVTTRNMNVATMMGGDKGLYKLDRLSEADCWSVFRKHAFENRNVDESRALEPIGRGIIKKCGGSPLAARALGGLLRRENRGSQWTKILDNKIWNLTTDECKILPALRLSYTHLPLYLKRCFTYCAIFPKDYEFDKEELIRLWMAEGLIQPSKDNDQEMEDVGNHYFDELLSRSFFQSSSSDRSHYYVMHDLINDLAITIAKDTCLHLDAKSKNDLLICSFYEFAKDTCLISETIRHSSILRGFYDTFDKFERFRNKENLRTFITLPIDKSELSCHISNKVVLELIPRMRHLRVLSLGGYRISEIPDSFGELKHLRYLNLSYTYITCLPNSVGDLYNLQTLKLSHCQFLTELPISIGTLTSLRCLDVRGPNKLKEMPAQISKLKHLQILSNLIVSGSNNNLSVEDLRIMSHLRGKLCISILENVASIQNARDGSLKSKHSLEKLIIRWERESNDLEESTDDDAESVLGFLQPHVNLKKLQIQSYGALKFPCWVNDIVKFDRMVKLSLVNCRKCETLPCLGLLPSLKHLDIQEMDGVKAVGAEFYGWGTSPSSSIPTTFKALETLSFACMPNWQFWLSSSSSTHSSFPRLQQLTIYSCPELIKKLPTCLPSLTKLTIDCSPRFESSFLGLPFLNELYVHECNEEALRSGNDLTSLTNLTISSVSGLIKLQDGFVGFLGALQDLTISACPEMISPWEDGFELENIHHPVRSGDGHQLVSLGLGFGLGCNLKSLQIHDCERLERLPNGWHEALICLEKLSISQCPELVSFPDGFPPMLRDVTLHSCKGLKHLPDGMMMITRNSNSNSSCRLECLSINECPSFNCFPKGQLPTTLKKLCILFCGKLESLPEGIMQKQHQLSINIPSLEILELCGCSSLTSFPQGSLPSTLKQLELSRNQQLESISGEIMFQHNNSLQYLTIRSYPHLKTLPADSLYSLTELIIIRCENLEFEHNQFENLSRLTYLVIRDCGNIKRPLSQWGLANLPSLESLNIGGLFPDADSFSDTDHHRHPLLPLTLTSLYISSFRKLESLAPLSLQTLTSFRSLWIGECPKLRSILPNKAVIPHALAWLHIEDCPLLEGRYSPEKGEYWPEVAHIPRVEIR